MGEVTKAEFVSQIAEKAGISRAAAARAVNAVFGKRLRMTREPRYGLVARSGHRLYTAEDVAMLARIKALVDEGLPIGEAISRLHRSAEPLSADAESSSILEVDDTSHTLYSIGLDLDNSPSDEEIRELAIRVWESAEDAEEFLTTPHGLLDGQTPLAASRTDEGAKRVREILLALEYGLPV
jgi:DNA-binding transcriptional MerR regulator